MNAPSPEVFAATAISDGLCPILATAIDPDATTVLVRLLRAGHRAYLVGGCVRDLLLGGTPKDFDIATSARPRQVKKIFRNSRIIGRRFRLVHVMFGGNRAIEVSTFRRDPNAGEEVLEPEAPLRDAGVPDGGDPDGWEIGAPAAATATDATDGDGEGDGEADEADLLIREDNVYGSEAEDAVRRDFTINGLFYDVQSESVLDYVGGVADLRRRVLRTIGDAPRRVREDPVRILRAVKFAVRLDLSFDPDLAAAIAEHHEDLRRSAAPRVFEEILRMLGGPHPQRSVALLARLGVLRVLFPELGLQPHTDGDDPRLTRLLDRLAAVGDVDRGRRALPTAIYLAVLFYDELLRRMVGAEVPDDGPHHAPSEALDDFLRPIGQRFRMAKRDTARVRAMFLALRRVDPLLADPDLKKRRRRGGVSDFVRREFFHDALLLLRVVCVAEKRDLAPVVDWEQREMELARETRQQPAIHRHEDRREERNEPRNDARPAARDRGLERGDTSRRDAPAPTRDSTAAPREERSSAPSDPSPNDAQAPARRRRRRRRHRGLTGLSGGPADDQAPADTFDS